MTGAPVWLSQRPDWVKTRPGWARPPEPVRGMVTLQLQPVPAGADARVIDVLRMPADVRVTLVDGSDGRAVGHWYGNGKTGRVERHERRWMSELSTPAVMLTVDADGEVTGTRWEPRRRVTLRRTDPHAELVVMLRVWEPGWREYALGAGGEFTLLITGDVPVEHFCLRSCERGIGRHMPGATIQSLDGRQVPANL